MRQDGARECAKAGTRGWLRWVAAAVCWLPWAAEAGSFSVSPVRYYFTPRDRALAMTVTNEGDERLVMQADLFQWSQSANGEDILTPTEDLILAPPLLQLDARARQTVRLVLMQRTPLTTQRTYRVIVRETHEAQPADNRLAVHLALAFSMPIFITPPSARGVLECDAPERTATTFRVSCGNSGNAYVLPRAFALYDEQGGRIAEMDGGAYLLPGARRQFELRALAADAAGGAAWLEVTLDDGSTRRFDLKPRP